MHKDEAERTRLLQALSDANRSRQVAAKALGIHQATLFKKLRQFDIM